MADEASPAFPLRPGLVGELLTDASSWMVLVYYLDAAAWIGVPPRWPPATRVPGTDFGRLAVSAIEALCWGLPGRRTVRAAVILNEAKHWLARSGQATALPHDDADLLDAAAVYATALCPVRDQRAALDLLDPQPLNAERARLRRHHPIHAVRRNAWPTILDAARWQESLWWQRAKRADETVPLVHAAAGIAAAIWSWPYAVHDPIGIRHELHSRVIRARAWAATGYLDA